MSHWHNIDNNNNLSDVGVRNATSQTRCGFCGNQISHGYIKRDQTNDQKTPNKNNKPQTNTSTAPTPNFMCKKRVSPRLCRVATRTTWTLTVAGLLNGLTTGFPQGGITLIAVLIDAHVGLWGNGIPVYPNLHPISGGTLFYPVPHDTK